MGITVLCPTRGNPAALLEAYYSFHDTAMEKSSSFVAVVDEDDPSLKHYVELCEDTIDLRIDLVPLGEAGTMNKALNYAAVRWAERNGCIGFIGDDHRFRTKGWDRTIGSVMDQVGGGYVYGDDLFQREKLPTAIFISSVIVKALGWYAPPKQRHLYLDDAWKRIGDATESLYYLPDIIIEHMHPAAGKGTWDPNHVRVNSNEMYEHDSIAFSEWLAEDFDADVTKVLAALGR